uniref:Cobaltochelatase subunit CobN n=1 Tax=Desertifilum tharense IPPAS B-1220 TaxID=1781255 RepID=A0ACD5GMW7_9CYAN
MRLVMVARIRVQARPEVLQQLLKTTGRVVQEIDSVEYGLTDIQEYYANTGGLKRAAEKQQGKKVKASFIESFSKDTTPRNLESLLRMEYRTKLLNPKWAEAMANQGSGGTLRNFPTDDEPIRLGRYCRFYGGLGLRPSRKYVCIRSSNG